MSTRPSWGCQRWTAAEREREKLQMRTFHLIVIKMSQKLKSAGGLLPQRCPLALHQCGCCWLVHMQTGSGKTDAGWRLSCCREHASGKGPHHQRKDQSVMGERKEREEKKVHQGNSDTQWFNINFIKVFYLFLSLCVVLFHLFGPAVTTELKELNWAGTDRRKLRWLMLKWVKCFNVPATQTIFETSKHIKSDVKHVITITALTTTGTVNKALSSKSRQ